VTGEFDRAAALLEPIKEPQAPIINVVRYWLATIRGRHEEALRWASRIELSGDDEGLGSRDLMIAQSNHWLGREDEARRGFETVVAAMSERLKAGQDPQARQILSQAYAGLGRREEALREATLAADMVSLTRDAMDGPDYLDNLAQVYAAFGDVDRALDLIDQVLSVPGELTVPFVEHYQGYAPLRRHPRFQEIIRKHRRP
jgi:tetratricopeptide (TPR) repeat protein